MSNSKLRNTHTQIGTSKFLEFWIDVSGDLQVPPVTSTTTVKRSDDLNIPFVYCELTVLRRHRDKRYHYEYLPNAASIPHHSGYQ